MIKLIRKVFYNFGREKTKRHKFKHLYPYISWYFDWPTGFHLHLLFIRMSGGIVPGIHGHFDFKLLWLIGFRREWIYDPKYGRNNIKVLYPHIEFSWRLK